jgi:hypothetical protein
MTIKPLAMKKHYHIFVIGLLLASTLSSSAQKSVFSFPFENDYKLPPLETFVKADEIATTYQTIGNLYTTEIIGLGDNTMEQTSSTYISDVKAIDALRFLKFYMEDQLISPGDQTRGSVELSVIYYNVKHRVNLGTALNVLTLGIGGLLGIPYSTAITDVEVEASFFDKNNQLLTVHRGVGRGKMLESLYNLTSSGRIPHQKAMRKALSDLNERIMADTKLMKIAAPLAVPEP